LAIVATLLELETFTDHPPRSPDRPRSLVAVSRKRIVSTKAEL
jgi:hypothetical protein